MKPIVVSIAAFAVLGLVACADQSTVTQQGREIQVLKEKVKALEGRLGDRAGAGTLENQERCSRQAAVAFRQGQYTEKTGDFYESHFNTKLGRCFIYITSVDTRTDPGAVISTNLLADAFELREYGTYMEKQGGRTTWKAPLCQCRGADGEITACTNGRSEFDAFVKRLMTE